MSEHKTMTIEQAAKLPPGEWNYIWFKDDDYYKIKPLPDNLYQLSAGARQVVLESAVIVRIELSEIGSYAAELADTCRQRDILIAALKPIAEFDCFYTGYCDEQLLSRAAVMAQWQVDAMDALKAMGDGV